jgi:hypothetical protein
VSFAKAEESRGQEMTATHNNHDEKSFTFASCSELRTTVVTWMLKLKVQGTRNIM